MTQPATSSLLWDFVVAGVALALVAGGLMFTPVPGHGHRHRRDPGSRRRPGPGEPRREDHW
ncbi:hypothetical protein [Streptomyces sp. NPDC059092]|uniref:hypothetical protein n=1 Tax=Streptomyces sp. NPDC059092 TaxID=3346725 RepID=UPI00367D14DF